MATSKKNTTPKFYAEIKENEKGEKVPVLQSRSYYQSYIDNAFKTGQYVTITIKKHYRNRSTGNAARNELGNQNGYLYAVVLPPISEKTGFTIDETCDALETLLCKQYDNQYGMPKILRFKEMTTIEFNDYVIDAGNPDSVRSWALRELEIDIPEPNKEYEGKGYEPEYED